MSVEKKRKLKMVIGISAIVILLLSAGIAGTIFRLVSIAFRVPSEKRVIQKTMLESLGAGAFEIKLETDEGEFAPGWYKEGDNGAAIVLLHGLGGTRAQLSGIGKYLSDAGFGVLLIDQRGHGRHSTAYTTLGRLESLDALAAVNWLRERPEVDPDRVGMYGASMGASTCIRAAAEDPLLACAIADSSYTDFESQAYFDLEADAAPFRVHPSLKPSVVKIFMDYAGFFIGKCANYPDPIDVIADIKCPLFLIHGSGDIRIDPNSINELASKAREGNVDFETWTVPDGGHCDYIDDDDFLNRILQFFNQHLK